jgi:uncharacterized repeat protein (TIGR01451 family)
LWFTEGLGQALAEINPTTHVITAFPTSGGGAGITTGPDGNLWLAEGDVIGQAVLTDLALSGAAPVSVALGSNLTYSLTVSNNGEENASGVVLNDTLPPGLTFVSATGGIVPVNGALTFNLGTLTAGASTGVTIEVTPTAVGNLNDLAQISMSATDPTPTDDSVTLFTAVTGATTTPDLALSGNAPSSVTLGSDVTYTLTVTNDGTAGASGVTVADSLPSGATFVSASDAVTLLNGALTFNVGSLAAGGSASLTVVVTPTVAGTLNDQATASMDQTDPTPSDNGITLTTVVTTATSTPDLLLSGAAPKSVTVESNVTYSLTVTNNGTVSATGVAVTDTLPAGTTFVSATGGVKPVRGALTFPVDDLAPGNSASFTVIVAATTAGTLTNTATAGMNQTDPTPADNSLRQVTMVTEPLGVDGPIVTSVQRFGFHALPTTLVLTFDKLLDLARAQNPHNYQIVALGGARGRIRITSASYNPATRTVTLRPAHRLNLHHLFRLTVVGKVASGVTDVFGNRLDGQNAPGASGSDFVTIVSAADLVLTTTNPANLRAYEKILRDERAWEQRLGAAGELATSTAS